MARRRWLVPLLLLASACSGSESSPTATSAAVTESTTAGHVDVIVTTTFERADGGVTVVATLHNSPGTSFEIPYLWELQRADGDNWSTVGFIPWVGYGATPSPALCPAVNTCEVAASVKIVDDGETMQMVARVAELADGSYRVVAPDLEQFTQVDTPADLHS